MPDPAASIYYGGASWRAIGWSPALGAFVGVREIAGALIIEAWAPENVKERVVVVVVDEARKLQSHGESAILSLFARLIGGVQ